MIEKTEVTKTKPAHQESQEKTTATSEKRKENAEMTSDESKKQSKKQKREEYTPGKERDSPKTIVTLSTIQSVVSEISKSEKKVALRDVIEKIASKHHLDSKEVRSRFLKKIHVSIGQNGAVILQ